MQLRFSGLASGSVPCNASPRPTVHYSAVLCILFCPPTLTGLPLLLRLWPFKSLALGVFHLPKRIYYSLTICCFIHFSILTACKHQFLWQIQFGRYSSLFIGCMMHSNPYLLELFTLSSLDIQEIEGFSFQNCSSLGQFNSLPTS